MQKAIFGLLALAVSVGVDPVPALADGIAVARPAKVVRPAHRIARCRYDRCGYPAICPDGTCRSLYGAYGPYGGAAYWSRYSYGGWGRGY